jgi:polar amino acid transport system substrate-binding protein
MEVQMKKGFFLLFLILMFCCHWFLNSMPKEIVIAYHEDFPPYCFEESGEVAGIFPEMVIKAAQKIGVKVKFKKFPWKRMLQSGDVGDVDAIMPLVKNKKRMDYLIYPGNGIALTEVSFFTRSDSVINYSGDLNDLKPYIIGVVQDYDYGEEFKNATYLQKDYSPSDEILVEKLIRGRFRVLLGPDRVVKHYAGKLGAADKIKLLPPVFVRKILYLAFSKVKNHQVLADRFSEAIEALGIEGEHYKILEKYQCGEDIAFLKEIIIGTDKEDYPRYSYWENGQIKGVCPEIISRAAEMIGVKVRYKAIPWGDFPDLAKKGEIDGIMPLFKTKERMEFLNFPDNGLAAEKNYFFTLKNNVINYSGDLQDLRGIPIGVVRNYSYGENFDKFDGLKKNFFPSVEALVEGVKKGKVKIGIGEYGIISYLIKKLGITERIKFLPPPFPREFLYLAFSKAKGKGYQKLKESFSNAFAELRKSGNIQEILKNYQIEKRDVLLAADNWQPYYGDNLPGYGPIAEIITEAFKLADYQVKIEFVPWANLLDKVKKGKYDGGFAASSTAQREKDYYLSDLIRESSPIVIYKRIDTIIIYRNLADLKNYRIGVVRDYIYDPAFDNAPGLQRIAANNPKINIDNLLSGRLDLVVIDESHAKYLLDKISPAQKNKLEAMDFYPEKKEVRHELHLLISKECVEAEQIRIDFNHGLKQLLEEGTVEKILKKHGVYHDW